MENHLDKMRADVDAMEQMFSNPTEGENDPEVSTDEAQTAPEDTLDTIIENVEVKEDVAPKRNNWKSRYTKYKRSTDATIFELRKENSNLISRVQTLTKRVDEMQVSTDDATSFTDRFSDVDKEVLGEDAITSMEQATNAAIEPLKRQLADEKAWREKQLENQRTKSKTEANNYFLSALAKAVPDYVEIDTDPAFEAWMGQPDSISGISRVKLFKQAEYAGDAGRVADFMNEFKAGNRPVDKLKNKVSPVTTSSTSPAYDQDIKMSMVEVQGFYDDVLKGKYRSNETKRLEMDNKINEAFATGNVY